MTVADEDRKWATAAHVCGVANVMFAPAGLLAALIVYSARRSASPYVRENARNALNAQITSMLLLGLFFVGALACMATTFIPLMLHPPAPGHKDDPPLLGVALYFGSFAGMFCTLFGSAVMSAIGAIHASGGKIFRYFYAIPFVR